MQSIIPELRTAWGVKPHWCILKDVCVRGPLRRPHKLWFPPRVGDGAPSLPREGLLCCLNSSPQARVISVAICPVRTDGFCLKSKSSRNALHHAPGLVLVSAMLPFPRDLPLSLHFSFQWLLPIHLREGAIGYNRPSRVGWDGRCV